MFRNDRLARPRNASFAGALIVAVAVFLGSQASAVAGYVLAVSTLVIILVAVVMETIWPTRAKKENVVVFSLFWGTMIGLIVPFLIAIYLEGGFGAVYEMLKTPP